jgi:hypothetical protein
MNAYVCKDWRELSEAVSRETDPKKLLELVEELNRVLEERENQLKKLRAPQNGDRFSSSLNCLSASSSHLRPASQF